MFDTSARDHRCPGRGEQPRRHAGDPGHAAGRVARELQHVPDQDPRGEQHRGQRSSPTSRSPSTRTRSRRTQAAWASRSTIRGARRSAIGFRPTRPSSTRPTPSAASSSTCRRRRPARRCPRTPTTRRCSRPTAGNALDPSQRRYKLNIRNRSDYNIDAASGTITPTRTTDEDWQINLVPQGTNDISSACVQSFRYVAAGSEALLVPTTGATIENVTDPLQSACLIARPPLDVVLVLDHSGSMASPTTGASGDIGPLPPCCRRCRWSGRRCGPAALRAQEPRTPRWRE